MAKKQTVVWAPQPGRQTEALSTKAFELLYGGAKFGGKTQGGKAWLCRTCLRYYEKPGGKEILQLLRASLLR